MNSRTLLLAVLIGIGTGPAAVSQSPSGPGPNAQTWDLNVPKQTQEREAWYYQHPAEMTEKLGWCTDTHTGNNDCGGAALACGEVMAINPNAPCKQSLVRGYEDANHGPQEGTRP